MAEEVKTTAPEKKFDFLEFFQKHQKWIIIAIFALAFIIRLYIYIYTANQPIWWDEGDYTYSAKRWGLDLGTRDLWYYRRTFFWPLLLAGMFKVGFGEHAMRFVTLLFSLGTVGMTYLAGKELFDKKVGMIAAFGMAVARLPLFLAGRLLTETPATFLVLTAYYFFIKGHMKKEGSHYIYLSAFFLAVGMLTRWATLLSLIPLIIYLLCTEKFKIFKNKQLWIFAAIILLILSPFLISYSMNFPAGAKDFVQHYLGTAAAQQGEGAFMLGVPGIWAYFIDLIGNMSIYFFVMFLVGLTIFLDLILGADMIFKKEEIARKLFFLLWILSPLVFHGMFSEYVDERYILWAYPMLFLLIGVGTMKIYDAIKRHKKFIAIAFMTVLLVVGAISQLGAAKSILVEKRYSYEAVMESGYWLKANTRPGDVIISQSRPQHAYYSERNIYSYTQAKNESDFDEMLKKLDPKYMVISIYESSAPKWSYDYGQRHNLTVANAWFADKEKTKGVMAVYQLR